MLSPEQYIGAKVADRYTLKQPLGRGGAGVVLGADDEQSHAQVALKLMENIDFLEAEVDALYQIYHPNVIPVFDHGYAVVQFRGASGHREEHPYVSMMWANNGTVADLLRRRSAGLSTADTVAILSQTANGVQDAHDLGIVHRDLKPENLLIHQFFPDDIDRQVLVTDFGIAKQQQPHAAPVRLEIPGGTPVFMPPEAFAKNVPVSQSWDIYAAGIIGYQSLTGQLPYEGDNIWAIIGAHVTGNAASFESRLGKRMTNVHAALEPVVRKAMHKNARERYGSMGDYGEALRTTYHDAIGSDRGTVVFEMTTKPSPGRSATPAPILPSEVGQFRNTTTGLNPESFLPPHKRQRGQGFDETRRLRERRQDEPPSPRPRYEE